MDADLDMEGIGERDFPQEGVLAPQSKIARQEKYKKSPKKSLELGGSNNGSEALLEDDEEKIVGKLRLELWSPPNDEGDSFELAREDHDSADREAQLLEALQLKDFMPKGKLGTTWHFWHDVVNVMFVLSLDSWFLQQARIRIRPWKEELKMRQWSWQRAKTTIRKKLHRSRPRVFLLPWSMALLVKLHSNNHVSFHIRREFASCSRQGLS